MSNKWWPHFQSSRDKYTLCGTATYQVSPQMQLLVTITYKSATFITISVNIFSLILPKDPDEIWIVLASNIEDYTSSTDLTNGDDHFAYPNSSSIEPASTYLLNIRLSAFLLLYAFSQMATWGWVYSSQSIRLIFFSLFQFCRLGKSL